MLASACARRVLSFLTLAVSLPCGACSANGGDPTGQGGTGMVTSGSNAGGAAAQAGSSGAGLGGSSSGSGGSGNGGAGNLGGGGSGVAGTGGSAGASGGGGGSGGTGTPGACPADAFFCTGFEEAVLPAGATYRPAYKAGEWNTHMKLQGVVKNSGVQALELPTSGEQWRMLSWPLPATTFWTRLYVRSSVDLGQEGHNAFFMAMTGDGNENSPPNVEVAEQFCQVVLNREDDVVVTIGGMKQCGTGIPPLAKDTWHCMEAFFDGPSGVVRVYANNQQQLIEKTDFTPLTFASFSLGLRMLHGPERTMYYDDVAVGPTRIGCP